MKKDFEMLAWFYELPEDDLGRYVLIPPKGREDEFLVFCKSISIQGVDYFLVEAVGKDKVLGLLAFFLMFTGRFDSGSYGYSDGISRFLVKFDNGRTYLFFKFILFVNRIKVSYIPAFLLHNSKKIDIWYWL